MQKIPTLFVRDENNRRYVTPVVTPGCEWVLAGEGRATVKWDGTCVMFDGVRWWARREVKRGKEAPTGWIEIGLDETTGKRVGWEPAEQSSFHRQLLEAIDDAHPLALTSGTFELVGPKINGNPIGFDEHRLLRHGAEPFTTGFTWEPTFESLSKILPLHAPMEGLVFWHPDGRMAKIKRRDFPRVDQP